MMDKAFAEALLFKLFRRKGDHFKSYSLPPEPWNSANTAHSTCPMHSVGDNGRLPLFCYAERGYLSAAEAAEHL